MPENEIDLSFLCDLLREAGRLALGQRGQWIAESKADHSPVTVVDRQVETLLIERIAARYPEHLILSEESGLRVTDLMTGSGAGGQAEYAWAIDPIDGTRAFASGLPVWGISAGVLRNGRPWAGGFYLPVTDEMYWGSFDESHEPDGPAQAWYNQQRISRLAAPDPDSMLTFLAVPSEFHHHFEVTAPRIRSMGSTAAHLAYVATGAALGMLTRKTNLWDIAGVLPLAQAVGVKLVYLSGRPFSAGELLDGLPIREALVAAHPDALPELLASVRLK